DDNARGSGAGNPTRRRTDTQRPDLGRRGGGKRDYPCRASLVPDAHEEVSTLSVEASLRERGICFSDTRFVYFPQHVEQSGMAATAALAGMQMLGFGDSRHRVQTHVDESIVGKMHASLHTVLRSNRRRSLCTARNKC